MCSGSYGSLHLQKVTKGYISCHPCIRPNHLSGGVFLVLGGIKYPLFVKSKYKCNKLHYVLSAPEIVSDTFFYRYLKTLVPVSLCLSS